MVRSLDLDAVGCWFSAGRFARLTAPHFPSSKRSAYEMAFLAGIHRDLSLPRRAGTAGLAWRAVVQTRCRLVDLLIDQPWPVRS
jgi:hypothetical protein